MFPQLELQISMQQLKIGQKKARVVKPASETKASVLTLENTEEQSIHQTVSPLSKTGGDESMFPQRFFTSDLLTAKTPGGAPGGALPPKEATGGALPPQEATGGASPPQEATGGAPPPQEATL